jgi:hypothetical protein
MAPIGCLFRQTFFGSLYCKDRMSHTHSSRVHEEAFEERQWMFEGHCDEETKGATNQTVADKHLARSGEWPWLLTPTCVAILERTHTFAYVMGNPEATGEHLLTMLALDTSGQGEIAKRGYNWDAAFKAAYLSLLSKERLTYGVSQVAVATSDDLYSIMTGAAAIAQGCEKSPRAIATSDIVETISSRNNDDPVKRLLSAKLAKTAAEEARDGVRFIIEHLESLRLKADGTNNRMAALERDLVGVQTLAIKTANENNARWTKATVASFVVLLLTITGASLLAVFGGPFLHLAQAG